MVVSISIVAASSYSLVQKERFADVLDLRNGALKVKGFRQDDLEYLHREISITQRSLFCHAYLLNINAMTRTAEDQTSAHSLRKAPGLIADLLLILLGKVDKVIIFCPDQEWDRRLIEAAALSVPLFNAIQRRLSSQIKHKEDCDGVVAD